MQNEMPDPQTPAEPATPDVDVDVEVGNTGQPAEPAPPPDNGGDKAGQFGSS